jgi:hypothetical protein
VSWHLVDGIPLPDLVAGHPALDFCNTRAGWGQPDPKEYLTDPRALTLWTVDAGLINPTAAHPLPGPTPFPLGSACPLPEAPDPTPDLCVEPEHLPGQPSTRDVGLSADLVLREALALREALYVAALGRGTARDWQLISDWAARARSASRLVPGPDGAPARWVLEADGAPLRGAAPAPDGDVPAGSRRPAGRPELPLLAIAQSAAELLTSPLAPVVAACPGVGCGWLFADPRRRRRWCSMAVCGNRAKARRHAERRTT